MSIYCVHVYLLLETYICLTTAIGNSYVSMVLVLGNGDTTTALFTVCTPVAYTI